MDEDKNSIRKSKLELRRFLSKQEINEKSKKIIETLVTLPQFKESSFIMCYVDFRNEVNTMDLIDNCLRVGKRVAVPYIFNNGNSIEMIASEIFSIKDLEKGTYGILEPSKHSVKEINPLELDLVVVPGVVFDRARNRIGYGGGFYDRFLKKVDKTCYKVALAFCLQVLDEIPALGHDMKVDSIITESTVIY